MLRENFHLDRVQNEKVFTWIKENNLHQKDFLREKNNWENEVKKRPGLFSDTKLLIVEQDILLLKAPTNDNVAFLAKNYQVDSQTICQKLFREKKNIIVISEEQWNNARPGEKFLVLWKDRENCCQSLTNWLEKMHLDNG